MAIFHNSRISALAALGAVAGLGAAAVSLRGAPPGAGLASFAPPQATIAPASLDPAPEPALSGARQNPSSHRLAAPAADEPTLPESATTGAAPPRHEPLTIATVNTASFNGSLAGGASAGMLKAQILLDRAGFSPGAIDAADNANFRKAVAAFQRQHGIEATGTLDAATWEALLATSAEPVLVEYEITQADLRGPFAPDIPDELEARARLKRLSHRGPRELLAERFHMDLRLLTALNPQAAFDRAGTRIVVPLVGRRAARGARVARIEVDKAHRRLRAYDTEGRLVAAYPASIGSADKPTPSGAYTVRRIARNPEWRYNPRFAFKEVKTNRAFRVAAGPNNPLGTVWIGINKPSYGIHGTPVAEEVGTAASHGCVRLTNWDAQALAAMVRRGTRVEFIE